MNGTNGLSLHLRGEKIGDRKMGKCICCCKLERLNSFEDLIRFLMHDTKGKKFYEARKTYTGITSCIFENMGRITLFVKKSAGDLFQKPRRQLVSALSSCLHLKTISTLVIMEVI